MININAESGAAIRVAKLSEFSLARLFGRISPKISTRTVITAVAKPTLPAPNFSVNSTVASDDESILTTLFPIRIAVRALSKLSQIVKALAALLLPPSAIFLSLILLQEENAVSVAEQIADITNNTAIKTMSIKNQKILSVIKLFFGGVYKKYMLYLYIITYCGNNCKIFLGFFSAARKNNLSGTK